MTQVLPEQPVGKSILKVLLLIALVYLFLVSISMMGAGLKRAGIEFIENFIAGANGAFVGLFIGLLATSIIQSSSTTTSIVVGLVAGGMFSLNQAIPIIMGANIGTSVTNALVSLGHINNKIEFKRAFQAAIVHDVFNFLTVLLYFPLELKFNLLAKGSLMMEQAFEGMGGLKFVSPLKVIVSPVAKLLDHQIANGYISAALALLLLFVALRFIVVTMKSLVLDRLSNFFDKVIFRSTITSLTFGLFITTLVQSSSVTTSLIVPLAGAGLVTIRQVYPYTLGANIGTTVTAVMASMVTQNATAVAVAFAHLLFNIAGICVFLPLRFIPLKLAEKLANLAIRNKFIPVFIILFTFLVLPLSLILLVR